MANKIKILALTGTRLTGKDSFIRLLRENDPRFIRVSFADELKQVTRDISFALFNKPICELSPSEKEIMRPIWIYVGTEARKTNIDCWAEKVQGKIRTAVDVGCLPVISDMRFRSEYDFYKNLYGDSMFLINITREGAPEPTEEEKIHGPEVARMADYHLHWKTDETFESLRPQVKLIYDTILS